MRLPVVQVLFVFSFLVCRVLVGPFLAYRVFICPTSSIIVKVRKLTCMFHLAYFEKPLAFLLLCHRP